ncbi:hypothetical protein UFOVP1077_30 [uncultured Caudovirales phage]|uniref:Homeodomain-like domain containing protein n=1 Tax=uncultured Caudovirales phage TaxID=2100421 RepID=A0A6J5QN39_9CAUD|nr:hypothetical protein UFOVP1077_30 [uncultured Caudovirales phage]CAB4197538.1 hypothetical protein UFOVP1316_18 [uncultured Caudovirales phage]CAB4211395.1 hypothetical protein UFOVP1428_27 [uncultured Caudovirales phage]CAB5227198.1 hypothetical protein UFOVP1526_17 [uncultured Caudovirales phage]
MGREGNYANGERNGRARWSDHDVELVRQLRDGGMRYAEIALKMGLSINLVRDWCQYRKRCEPTHKAA